MSESGIGRALPSGQCRGDLEFGHGRAPWGFGSGARFEVLGRAGHVVARTGERYQLLGAVGFGDDAFQACLDGVHPPL
jgi:hypothetical protein